MVPLGVWFGKNVVTVEPVINLVPLNKGGEWNDVSCEILLSKFWGGDDPHVNYQTSESLCLWYQHTHHQWGIPVGRRNTSRATKTNHDQGKCKRSFVICDEMLLKILRNMCNDFLLAHSKKQPSVNFMTPGIHKLRIIDVSILPTHTMHCYKGILQIVPTNFYCLWVPFDDPCSKTTKVFKNPCSASLCWNLLATWSCFDINVNPRPCHRTSRIVARRMAFIIKSRLMSVQLIMQMMIVQNFFIGANTYLGGSSWVAERLVWKINCFADFLMS